MSIQQIQMLWLPVYDVLDGKVTTGKSVDKGILKETNRYEKCLLLLLLCFETRKDRLLPFGDTVVG